MGHGMGKWLGGTFMACLVGTLAIQIGWTPTPNEAMPWPLQTVWAVTVFLGIAWFSYGVALVTRGLHRYWNTYTLPPSKWGVRYWPMERIVAASGVFLAPRRAAVVVWQAQVGREVVSGQFEISESSGTVTREFGQVPMSVEPEPHAGDGAWLAVTMRGRHWWHGRTAYRVRRVPLDITDHR